MLSALVCLLNERSGHHLDTYDFVICLKCVQINNILFKYTGFCKYMINKTGLQNVRLCIYVQKESLSHCGFAAQLILLVFLPNVYSPSSNQNRVTNHSQCNRKTQHAAWLYHPEKRKAEPTELRAVYAVQPPSNANFVFKLSSNSLEKSAAQKQIWHL